MKALVSFLYLSKIHFMIFGVCKNFQITCGAELALMFVETLVKGKVPCNDESLGQFIPCSIYFL